MKNLVYTLIFGLAWICTGCSDFLESQTPQGSVDEEQLQDPVYIDNLVISAYAVWISRGYQLLFLFMELRCPLGRRLQGR